MPKLRTASDLNSFHFPDFILKKLIVSAVLCSLGMIGTHAVAKPKNPPVPVPAPATVPSKEDVTLDGAAANKIDLAAGVNPHGNAGSIGFTDSFGSGWSAIGGFEDDGFNAPHGMAGNGLKFTFSFDDNALYSGKWSVENTKQSNIYVDLVFAMHTGGGSGAWLFENKKFLAGTTQYGTWDQNMRFNGKSKTPSEFSNVTFFARNVPPPKPDDKPLPEPTTLGTLMLGLGMIGIMARRRKQT